MSSHRQPAEHRPLGEILVEEGWALVSDVQQALTDQLRLGQRLASLLIDRGLLDPDHAACALGRQHGVPAALLRHLADRDPEVARGLPPEVARACLALALVATRDRTVVVCVRDPDRPELRHALEHALGRPVTLVVASEAALLPLVHEVYGPPPNDFEIDMSFVDSEDAAIGSGDFEAFVSGAFTLAELDEEWGDHDSGQVAAGAGHEAGQGEELDRRTWLPRSAAEPFASASLTVRVESLPLRLAASALPRFTPVTSMPALTRPGEPAPPSRSGPASRPRTPSPALAPGALAAAAAAAMARALRKDQLLDATFSALAPVWSAAVLFSIKDSAARGQRGFGGLLTPPAVKMLVVPLHSPSLLRRAWQSRALAQIDGTPGGGVQDHLLRLLGGERACAVPVEVAGRVVGLLMAASPKDPAAPSVLVELAHHLGQHFGRIIRAAKRS